MKSSTNSINDCETVGKVLVLYTGGTIGMVRNDDGGKYFIFYLNK